VSAPATAPPIGTLLRDWRDRRRMSQLDLALEANVSARHISFVETGRSKPSRELLLDLAEHLEVPLRERNQLLLAAGFAPHYPEKSLDDPEMAPARKAIEKVLGGHEPFPAFAVDRRWDVIQGNEAALKLLFEGVRDQATLAPPLNGIRVSCHPDAMAPRVLNLGEYSAHLIMRLRRQQAIAPDPAVEALIEEVLTYPGVEDHSSSAVATEELVLAQLRLRAPDDSELTFFSTMTTFGTALDVTMSEVAIETLFPADPHTAAYLGGN
jgi:transcriptional regulator with XRE-family HTH domain